MRNLENSGRKRISSVKIYLLTVNFPGLSPGNQRVYLLIDDFPCRGIRNYIILVSKWKPASVNNLIIFILLISLLYGFSDLEFRFLVKNDILSLLQEKKRVV